jgi:hypothetical protein
VYGGQHFRSKLAAYWAVFFDILRIKYIYQTKRVDLDRKSYMPDFWILHSVPELAAEGWGFWGVCSLFLTPEETVDKVVSLVKKTKHNALIFEGYPWDNAYSVLKISGVHQDIPVVDTGFRFQQDQELGLIGLKGPHGSSFPTVPIPNLTYAYQVAREAQFGQ